MIDFFCLWERYHVEILKKRVQAEVKQKNKNQTQDPAAVATA